MPTKYCLALFATLGAGCAPAPASTSATRSDDVARLTHRLPTGARLDPAGTSRDLGSFPLSMIPSPDGRQFVILLNGWREQGVQVLDRRSGITRTLPLPAVFLGLVFSPDGRSLYVSGGNGDVIYRCDWREGKITLADSIILATRIKGEPGIKYPGGLAISADGLTLYAAENLGDSLAVIDLSSRTVSQRLATQRYPYGVVRASDGTVYASSWGGSTVSVFKPAGNGRLTDAGRIPAPRHPSALLLNRDGSRLFVASGSTDRVAVYDTRTRENIALLADPPPNGPREGSTPNALALSGDGTRLFVAEADNNSVAVFNLSARTANSSGAIGRDELSGRVPTNWYPTALDVSGGELSIVSGKGRGTGPNPRLEQPNRTRAPHTNQYTLGQISGTLSVVAFGQLDALGLQTMSARVARANGWDAARPSPAYPPVKHVIYIIKENRTYDQVFGDLRQADGDTSLLFFPRPVSPNHHALAERFGIFDRFFVNAEVSPDGHNWATAAYVTDYAEKTIPSEYSARRHSYDYEGQNRGAPVDDDVAGPASGYLWDLAEKAGIWYRNYGEFVSSADFSPDGTSREGYHATRPNLEKHTNNRYAGFSMRIPDQQRADVWLQEFAGFVRDGKMPALEIMRLPNDHTSGARAGERTPRAFMADNDLALGRIISALSKSPFWKSTAVFVLEDDAQSGADHVDSHRSLLLAISPYSRGGVTHRFVNTTDVVATIEEILGLGTMSQFDHFGRPLRDIWTDRPDFREYDVLTPSTPLDEMNPTTGALAEASKRLALRREDEADEALFNRILWSSIKGNRNYPKPARMPTLEVQRPR
ncbi:MAG: bifunctional YncE family protein/alkaline phosphatase family protein [Gemmatimonadaceae bacterium]|nr:bifunctional YncE family protein/alkaline phosphatase family protein [Gemmatimonadaceae bacterium]